MTGAKAQTTLRRDVAALCPPRGRQVGSRGHEKAKAYLIKRLIQTGALPLGEEGFALTYRRGGQTFFNIAGRFPGKGPSLPPLLLGAHYDSATNTPSADDNAAALAILLSLCESLLRHQGLARDVWVVFFDGEEPPYFGTRRMGSFRFYRDHVKSPRNLHLAIILDLVGHEVSLTATARKKLNKALPHHPFDFAGIEKHLAPLLLILGAESHPSLPPLVSRHALFPGLSVMAAMNHEEDDESDHRVFHRSGVPFLFYTNGLWKHTHQKTDTPRRLSFSKMWALTRHLQKAIPAYAQIPLPQTRRAATTAPLEIKTFRRATGTLYRPLLKIAGLQTCSSREDLDRVQEIFAKMLGL